MGIVRRQSIQSSFFIYIGFAIGALNIFLLPQFLSQEYVGLTRTIISTCTILVGLCNFGTLPVITRFYPYYRDHAVHKKSDLMTWVLAISLIGYLIMVAASFLFHDLIVRKFSGNSPLFLPYFYTIYPFTFCLLFYNLLESYATNNYKTVLPNFLRETGVRFYTLVLIGAFALGWISLVTFIDLFSLQFGVILLVLVIYLVRTGHFNFSFRVSGVTRRLYRRMALYASFVFGGGIFMLLEKNISVLFISSIQGMDKSAIFDIGNYIATVLLVPQRSIQAIATPLIATAWKDNDVAKVGELYKKSSATLLVAGCFIFGLIWLNIANIFQLLPPAYYSGKYIVLIIGLANLVELGTGLNYQIMVTSRIWRLDFYLSIGMVILFLFVNYLFTKTWGMTGSAVAMLLLFCGYNFTRFFILLKKYGLQPFNRKTPLILVIGLAAYGIASLLPVQQNFIADTVLRSALFIPLFAAGVLFFKVSEDVNNLWHLILDKIRTRL